MKENRIVAIVGMCGSGKSIVTAVFESEGWQKVHFGKVTMDEVSKRGMEVSEHNEEVIRNELRSVHGMGAFAKLLLPTIEEKYAKGNVVLDGLYSFSEYEILSARFGGVFDVLAVVGDRKTRYKRLETRQVRPLTPAEAESRDYSEIKRSEKGGPIAIADHFFVNNSDLAAFETKVAEFIRSNYMNPRK